VGLAPAEHLELGGVLGPGEAPEGESSSPVPDAPFADVPHNAPCPTEATGVPGAYCGETVTGPRERVQKNSLPPWFV
jgi:hypothetical protein